MTSALLRSWEERFRTIFYEAAPALVRLTITRPPQDPAQALALACELHAADHLVTERAGNLDQTARHLMTGQHPVPQDPSEPLIDNANSDIAC